MKNSHNAGTTVPTYRTQAAMFAPIFRITVTACAAKTDAKVAHPNGSAEINSLKAKPHHLPVLVQPIMQNRTTDK
jgi:hypothetical protein